MAKTAAISTRIDPELKHNAEQIFRELGLTTSQAITLFYKQVDLQRGLPFGVKVPNKVTKKALEDARTRRNFESFEGIDDLQMTKLLEQAIVEIEKLPEDAQDAIAARLLADLADENEWTARFAETTDAQWDRMAAMVRQEIAAGDAAPLDDVFPTLVSKP
jgi:addiction module RelB/DinJ family antitoxin